MGYLLDWSIVFVRFVCLKLQFPKLVYPQYEIRLNACFSGDLLKKKEIKMISLIAGNFIIICVRLPKDCIN